MSRQFKSYVTVPPSRHVLQSWRVQLTVTSNPLQCYTNIFQIPAPSDARRFGECLNTLTIRVEIGNDLAIRHTSDKVPLSTFFRNDVRYICKSFYRKCLSVRQKFHQSVFQWNCLDQVRFLSSEMPLLDCVRTRILHFSIFEQTFDLTREMRRRYFHWRTVWLRTSLRWWFLLLIWLQKPYPLPIARCLD